MRTMSIGMRGVRKVPMNKALQLKVRHGEYHHLLFSSFSQPPYIMFNVVITFAVSPCSPVSPAPAAL